MILATARHRFTDNSRTRVAERDAKVRMGVPSAAWSRGELSERARWENEQIGHGQRCAPRYWYLGKILLLVQADVQPGCWKSWCREHDIQADRWKRGRLFAQAFASAEELADFTIEAAESEARQRLGREPLQTAADAKLRRSLASIDKALQNRLDEFANVTNPTGLAARIAELMRKLTALDHARLALEKKSKVQGPKSKVKSRK